MSRPAPIHCDVCGKEIHRLRDGVLTLRPSIGIMHGACSGELCYAIDLTRIASPGLPSDPPSADSLRGWKEHLFHKVWWSADVSRALDRAHATAVQLQKAALGTRRTCGLKTPRARLITARTRAQVMERDGFRCRRCGAGPDERKLVVDHVTPVAKGGTRDLGNLQTLCDLCNAGKSDRQPHAHDLREMRAALP